MANRHNKKKKGRNPCSGCRDIKLLGLILAALGTITICTFLLPLKAMIILLSMILVICGVLLFLC